jgi:hypothetical protein
LAYAVLIIFTEAFDLLREEGMGLLNQNARAISCIFLGPPSAAMVQIFEKRNRIIDQCVGSSIGQVHEHPHATVGTLAERDVQTGSESVALRSSGIFTNVHGDIFLAPQQGFDIPP